MELRQLKYFVTTAEKLSFSEAARALYITQSTLSQQVASLEKELGVKLFERNKHKMWLTDMGNALLPSALRTLQDATACIDHIHDVQGLECGEINIGTTYTFSPLLQNTVLEFMRQHPRIKLNIFCKSMEELPDMLAHRQIDVALSYKPLDGGSNIESHILFDSTLCAVVAKNHVLAKENSITFRDIEKHTVCLPAKGMQARCTLDRILDSVNQTNMDVRLEINDIHILLRLVAHSHLVTFLSQATVMDCPDVVAIPLAGCDCSMQGSFHVVKESYMKYATKAFLRKLCENKDFSMAMLTCLK